MSDYVFIFEAQTGASSEIVICKMFYERDEDGPFNLNIESVLYEGKEVIGLISEEQFVQLELSGAHKLDVSLEEGEERDEWTRAKHFKQSLKKIINKRKTMTTDIIIEKIKLQKIRLDGGTQPRKEIDELGIGF